MKTLLLVITLGWLIYAGCKKKPAPLSECITAQILQFSRYACEKGARVDQYRFLGQPIFLFIPGTCVADRATIILDQNCRRMGIIRSNIKRKGVIINRVFYTAKFICTVWQR